MANIAFLGEPRTSQNLLPSFLLMQEAVNALGYTSTIIDDMYMSPEAIADQYDLAVNLCTRTYYKSRAVNLLKGWKCDLKVGNAEYGQWIAQVGSPLRTLARYRTLEEIPAGPFYVKNIRGIKFGPLGYARYESVAEFTERVGTANMPQVLKALSDGVLVVQEVIPDNATYTRGVVLSTGQDASIMAIYSNVGYSPLNNRDSKDGDADVVATAAPADTTKLCANLTMPFVGDMEWINYGKGDTLLEINTRIPRTTGLSTYLLFGPDVYKNWMDCTVNRKPWTPKAAHASVTIRATRDADKAKADGFIPVPFGDIVPTGPNGRRSPLYYKV